MKAETKLKLRKKGKVFSRIIGGIIVGIGLGALFLIVSMILLATSEYPGEQNPELFHDLMVMIIVASIIIAIIVSVNVIQNLIFKLKYEPPRGCYGLGHPWVLKEEWREEEE